MIPDPNDRIGDESVLQLLPTENIATFEEHSLFMHLYRAVGTVLAVQEAMWEELLEVIRKDPASLRAHGWDVEDMQDKVARQKYEALVERYKG